MTGKQLAPYGPNTPVVRRFLVRFAALGAEQRAAVLGMYRRCSETPEWVRAELLLGETVESSGRSDVPNAIAGPLLQLVQPADGIVHDTVHDIVNEDEQRIDPIAEPALAAVLSLAVSDLLPYQAQSTLYAPFASTIPMDELR